MMPNENVTARAMSKTAVDRWRFLPPPMTAFESVTGGGRGGAAVLLVGGAAVAGLVGSAYSYSVQEQQLKALLPEGVAMPGELCPEMLNSLELRYGNNPAAVEHRRPPRAVNSSPAQITSLILQFDVNGWTRIILAKMSAQFTGCEHGKHVTITICFIR